MHLQEYDNVLIYQSKCVDRTRQKIDSYFSNNWEYSTRNDSLEGKILAISSFFIQQLLSSKGLVATIKESVDLIKGKDLSKTIADTDKYIKVYIHLKDTLDGLILRGNEEHFPELLIQQSVIGETIDNLYHLLRMLKRQNIKKNIETSQIAKDSSRHSVNSLETVLHGRSSA